MNSKLPVDLKVIEIPNEKGYHIYIQCVLNQTNITCLIDTGASKSVFDKKRIKNILKKTPKKSDNYGIGISKKRFSSSSISFDLMIGELKIPDYEASCIDLSTVNDSLSIAGISPIDGIIGGDILYKYKAVIDYKKKKLFLYKPS